METGSHVAAFLQNWENLSFDDMMKKVDQEEDSRPAAATSSSSKKHDPDELSVKKEKKSKKGQKEDDKDDEEQSGPGSLTVDPYLVHDVVEAEEAEEDEAAPSKRAMQRALKGFVRKSGGRKHKKKPAGAGKGPAAKGGGKRLSICLQWLRQVGFQ